MMVMVMVKRSGAWLLHHTPLRVSVPLWQTRRPDYSAVSQRAMPSLTCQKPAPLKYS